MKTAIDSGEGIGCEAMTTYGSCDVSGCQRETYMGWRPLTESRGRQICEYHWRRHLDETDNFDLFDAFGFRRPAYISSRRPFQTESRRSDSDRALQIKKQVLHEQRKSKPVKSKSSVCKVCGAERMAGHTYCDKCKQERKAESNRQRRRRSYLKTRNCSAFAPEINRPVL